MVGKPATRSLRRRLASALVPFALLVSACASAADGPSRGNYTLEFPSTEVAVATDTVQVFVFALPEPSARESYCRELIDGRKRSDLQKAEVESVPANICELLKGRRPITVPYGEWAVLAVGQRGTDDFVIGCAIQTIGEGDAPLPIELSLVNPAQAVPVSDCKSVSDACAAKCTRR